MQSFILILIAALCLGCNGREAYFIHGSKYSYRIPHEIVLSESRSSSGIDYGGDSANAISLIISDGALTSDRGADDYRISVIVFWDKKYHAYSGLVKESQDILSESKRIQCVEWEACYRRMFSGIETSYYFTFDPEKDSQNVTGEDFILSVYSNSSMKIGGVDVKGQPSCNFTQVVDGLLLQVSSVGELCNALNAKKVFRYLPELFASWRQEISSK